MKLFRSIQLLYSSQESFKYSLAVYVILFISGSIMLGLFEAASVRLVGPLLAALNEQSQSNPKEIYDISIFRGASLRLLTVTALAVIWRLFILWSAISIGSRLTSNIANTLYCELTNQDYESFVKYDQSELIARFTIDLERIRACYTTFLNLLSSLFLGVFLVAELLLADMNTTIICVLLFVLVYYICSLVFGSKLSENGRSARAASGRQINLLSSLFSSLYLLKNGRLRESYLNAYTSKEYLIRKLYSRLQFLSSSPRLLVEGIGIICLLVIIPSLNNETGLRVLPLLGIYGAGLYKLLPTLQAIYSNWNEYVANESFLASMHELVLELSSQAKALRQVESNVKTYNQIEIDGRTEHALISFRNVHFKYSGSTRYVISGINHSSYYGDKILITGPSGSGKSTYVNLLTGMIRPSLGNISISRELLCRSQHSQDCDASTRDLLSSACEHVPAHPFIFHGSLSYNITLESEDLVDESKLLECIEIVGLKSSFGHLNHSSEYSDLMLNSDIISNGERQKIGIARALYGNPKILVLDEALNSIDRPSATQILADLSAKSSAWIIYLISHQPIIDEWATQQITFEDGELVQVRSSSNPL